MSGGTMIRKTLVSVALLAFALGACSAQSTGRAVRVVPGPTVTVTASPVAAAPAVPPPVPSPRTSVLRTKIFAPAAVKAPPPAAYRLTLSCVEGMRRESGAKTTGSPISQTVDAVPGATLKYTFTHEPDSGAGDPVVESWKNCTMSTDRVRTGVEPRYAALLGCEGEATFSSGRGPTSAVAKSWNPLQDMLSPYTHGMSAPKSANQLSEKVSCVLSVVKKR